MNKGVLILVAAVGIAALVLWSRKSKADVPDPSEGDTDGGATGGGTTGTVKTPDLSGGTVSVKVPDLSGVVKIVAPPIAAPDPATPGSTPSNPLPSFGVFKGFKGYILVQTNDTPIKLASRLGTVHTELYRQNPFAVSVCPQWVRDKWNNGMPTIAFYARYGRTPGVDCVVPGWHAAWLSSTNGQFPVLWYGGEGAPPQ